MNKGIFIGVFVSLLIVGMPRMLNTAANIDEANNQGSGSGI